VDPVDPDPQHCVSAIEEVFIESRAACHFVKLHQPCSVADPGSGAFLFLTPGSGMGKKSRSRSGMNTLEHISESLETIFWVKIH
jgi:hypothetical protein